MLAATHSTLSPYVVLPVLLVGLGARLLVRRNLIGRFRNRTPRQN